MDKYKIITLVGLLILINLGFVNALDISVDTNIESTINVAHQVPVTFTNNEGEDIYNITLSSGPSYITFNQIDSLGDNQTIQRDISITTTQSGNLLPSLIFSFKKNTTVSPQTHEINITDISFGFSGQIRQGDIVNFRNVDTINHNIECVGINGNQQEMFTPNQVKSAYAFDKIETVVCTETDYFYNINIGVSSNLDLTTFYESNIVLNINSLNIETTVDTIVDIQYVNATLDYEDVRDVIMRIRNTGPNLAKNIRFSDNQGWVTYSANDFDLDSGQERLVVATIDPILTLTSQTNLTHIISLRTYGANFIENAKDVGIFINYHDFDEYGGTGVDWEEKRIFCEENPTSPYCISAPVIEAGIYSK